MSNIEYFLLPALKEYQLFQDLCYFINYLDLDMDSLYKDLRNKYTDFEQLSAEALKQAFYDLGADYIIEIIEALNPQNLNQLLGVVSLIQLFKGQIEGVRLLADFIGFNYTTVQWWEKNPLGEPNTASMRLDLGSRVNVTSRDFQVRLANFLKEYLYPIILLEINFDIIAEQVISGSFYYRTDYVFEEVFPI